MTALPLRDFTDAERDRLAAIEAAPAAEESLRERVALAIHDAWASNAGSLMGLPLWREMADAVLTVLSGPSSDAEQAVERVLALSDSLMRDAGAYQYAAPGSYDAGARTAYEAIAARLRAAVAGPTC